MPTGCSPSATGSAAAVGDTIIPARSPRICTSELSGRLRLMRTCVGSTTSTDSIIDRSAFTVDVSRLTPRSRLTLTAAASNGVPSWNVTPSRSVAQASAGRVTPTPSPGRQRRQVVRVEVHQAVVEQVQRHVVTAGAALHRVERRGVRRVDDAQVAALDGFAVGAARAARSRPPSRGGRRSCRRRRRAGLRAPARCPRCRRRRRRRPRRRRRAGRRRARPRRPVGGRRAIDCRASSIPLVRAPPRAASPPDRTGS